MNESNPHTPPARLGPTAHQVWHAWREATDRAFGHERIFGWVPHLGEVFWMRGELCRYVDYPGYRALKPEEEDRYWDALCKGQLQVHRRRYAPLIGADCQPSAILHAANGEELPSGLTL